jgi:uncharacterized protein (TIGR03437 family)
VVYSTFLGSAGNDDILGIDSSVRGQFDVLVSTPGLQFPVGSAPSVHGPVLLTVDVAKRAVVRSQYLPATDTGQPAGFSARWTDDGSVLVVTSSLVSTFAHDGRSLTRTSLKSPQFAAVPAVTADPYGDVWLTGVNTSREAQVVRLGGGTVEAFRWKVPAYGGAPTIAAPFFGPKQLVYLGGTLPYQGGLVSTTGNAILRTPCEKWTAGYVAVLERDGDLKMLSYFPYTPSFTLEKDRTVSASHSRDALNRITIDLTGRPGIACVLDALRNTASESVGVGQLVRILGGGFGGNERTTSPSSGRFPTRLEDLRVRVDGIDAVLLAQSEGEAIALIPYGIRRDGSYPMTVQDGGDRSEEFLVPVTVLAPRLLGDVLNENGTVNGAAAPAAWGSTVSVYLTGTGRYTPSLADGQIAATEGTRRLEAAVAAAWQTQGPAEEAGEVISAGPVPGLVGAVSRVVVRLPRYRPYGYSSIGGFLEIGGERTALPSVWVR